MIADGQPTWTETDRAKAIAWQLEQRSKCAGCGQPRSESMARENQLAYRAEVIRCFSCAEKDRQAEKYRKQEGADTAGLMTRLTHTPHGAV